MLSRDEKQLDIHNKILQLNARAYVEACTGLT